MDRRSLGRAAGHARRRPRPIVLASIVAVGTAVAALARDLIAGEAIDREGSE